MIEIAEFVRECGARAASVRGITLAVRGAGLDLRWIGESVRWGAAVVRPVALTALVAALAVLTLASETATGWLEGSRAAIADGQWWRLATGHATHWNADHLGWDLMMFVALGAVLESRCRRRFAVHLAASAVAISLAVLAWQPQTVSYRGLSGIDSALFVAVCLALWRDARSTGEGWRGATAFALGAAFAAKLAYEYATGSTLFVASDAAGFAPVPLAHLIGGLTAATVDFALCGSLRGRAIQPLRGV